MDRTEVFAYQWLLLKYKATDIERQQNPDFVTSDGMGWEVKKLLGKYRQKIIFGIKQLQFLKERPRTTILVFSKNSKVPYKIIPTTELYGNIDGINIVLKQESAWNISDEVFAILKRLQIDMIISKHKYVSQDELMQVILKELQKIFPDLEEIGEEK